MCDSNCVFCNLSFTKTYFCFSFHFINTCLCFKNEPIYRSTEFKFHINMGSLIQMSELSDMIMKAVLIWYGYTAHYLTLHPLCWFCPFTQALNKLLLEHDTRQISLGQSFTSPLFVCSSFLSLTDLFIIVFTPLQAHKHTHTHKNTQTKSASTLKMFPVHRQGLLGKVQRSGLGGSEVN